MYRRGQLYLDRQSKKCFYIRKKLVGIDKNDSMYGTDQRIGFDIAPTELSIMLRVRRFVCFSAHTHFERNYINI